MCPFCSQYSSVYSRRQHGTRPREPKRSQPQNGCRVDLTWQGMHHRKEEEKSRGRLPLAYKLAAKPRWDWVKGVP